MDLKDLKNLNLCENAPSAGTYLIYTRQKVEYGHYNSLAFLDTFEGQEMLEIHLFDKDIEYRAISSRTNGMIISIINDDGNLDKITEEISLENGESINLVSYINYDDNGMSSINNYRLQEVK